MHFECTNLTVQILLVFEIDVFGGFFFQFYRKLKFKIPNPVVGGCQSTLNGCESCLQIRLLKSLCF